MNSAAVGIGKGRKDEKVAMPPLKVLQSETLHSLNHLYQSAVYLVIRSFIEKRSLGDSIQKVTQLQSLARKSTIRLDASLRRSLCQKCHIPLLPGLTSTIRSQAFAPTNRVIKVHCRLCNLSRRQIASPQKKQNGNSLARRNRRKAVKKIELKLARQQEALSTSKPNFDKIISPIRIDTKVTNKKKWSQRARRRAGKIKALSMQKDFKDDIDDAIPKHENKNTRRNNMQQMPRYANRMKATDGWESKLTSEMSRHEKEAIRMLRGNHLLTSGIGRGGLVGQVDAASLTDV